MSFSFDFDLAELDDAVPALPPSPKIAAEEGNGPTLPAALVELTLEQLFASLPPVLSCTRQRLTANDIVYRRDLFDVRFQRASEDSDDEEETATSNKGDTARKAVWSASSDLISGVYEGGAATWECAGDIVKALLREETPVSIAGKRVLEVGCGSAVPSLWLLQTFFAAIKDDPAESDTAETVVVLQDYNDEVLSDITFPNVVLAFAAAFGELDLLCDGATAKLELSDDFLDLFRSHLASSRLRLVFLAGDWSAWPPSSPLCSSPFDLVLTSETVYNLAYLPPLIRLLQQASDSADSRSLVALKRVYFGVGGGEYEFRQALKRVDARADTVWSSEEEGKDQVGRVVLQVRWRE